MKKIVHFTDKLIVDLIFLGYHCLSIILLRKSYNSKPVFNENILLSVKVI